MVETLPRTTYEDAQRAIGALLVSNGAGDAEGVRWRDDDHSSAFVDCPLLGCEGLKMGLELVPQEDGSIKPNCYLGGHAEKDVRAWFKTNLLDLARRRPPPRRRAATKSLPVPQERDRNAIANAWRLLGESGEQLLLANVEAAYSGVYALEGLTGLWRDSPESLLKLHSDTCQEWQDRALAMQADGSIMPQEALELVKFLRQQQSPAKAEETAKSCGAALEQMREAGDERAATVSQCAAQDFDRLRGYLPCANGLVDLSTGAPLLSTTAKGYYMKYRTGAVAYDPSATHWAVTNLFAHLHPDRAAYLKACLGRAMWGRPDKIFLVLVGQTDTGKGTLFMALRAALGAAYLANNVSEDLLRGMSKQNKTGPTEERRALVEGLFALAEEAADWMVSTERLKTYSGGAPEVTFQAKYGKEITLAVTATIILSANVMPKLGLVDPAQQNRFRLIKYTKPEVLNPKMKEAFDPQTGDPQAATAMLALLVALAKENPPGHEIPIPDVVQQDIDEAIEAERSPFQVWLSGAVAPGDGNLHVKTIWNGWACHNSQQPDADEILGQKRSSVASVFRRQFHASGAVNVRVGTQQGRGWKGYRLVDGYDSPDFDPQDVTIADAPLADQPVPCATCGVPFLVTAAEAKQIATTGVGMVCDRCLAGGPPAPPPGPVQQPLANTIEGRLDVRIEALDQERMEFQTTGDPLSAEGLGRLLMYDRSLQYFRRFRAAHPNSILPPSLVESAGGVDDVLETIIQTVSSAPETTVDTVPWVMLLERVKTVLQQDLEVTAPTRLDKVQTVIAELLRVTPRLIPDTA